MDRKFRVWKWKQLSMSALHTSSESSSDPTLQLVMFPIGFLDSFWRSTSASLPPSLPSPSILRQTVAKLLLSIYSASPPHEKPTTNPIHPGIINRFEYHLTSSHLPSSSFLLLSKIETNCLEEGSFACNTPSFSSFHQGFKLKIGKK